MLLWLCPTPVKWALEGFQVGPLAHIVIFYQNSIARLNLIHHNSYGKNHIRILFFFALHYLCRIIHKFILMYDVLCSAFLLSRSLIMNLEGDWPPSLSPNFSFDIESGCNLSL